MSLVRAYLRRLMTIDISYTFEDEPPEDHFDVDCWGDHEDFREFVERINQSYQSGWPTWEWCVVTVTVYWQKGEEHGKAVIGGCSYKDEEDFKNVGS